MKLCQGQTWKLDQKFIRLTRLERLAVEYKVMNNLRTKEGFHHTVTKKEFCRLIKNAVLLSVGEISTLTTAPAEEAKTDLTA